MKLKLKGPEASLPLLCLADTSEFSANLQELLPQSLSGWHRWLECAQHNRIETQVWKNVQGLELPEFIRTGLAERSQVIRHQNQLRRKEAQRLFDKLAERQIPVVVLKGNAISLEIYKDADYKQMNDFDLLFKREDLDRLAEVYQELGYSTAAALGGNFRDQEKYSHHWPLFFSKDMCLFIGTHWGLVSPFGKIKLNDEEIWQRVRPLTHQVHRLSIEDSLHHFCVHLSPYKVGIKELSDIYNFLIFHRDDINWNFFSRLVEQSNSQESVFRALSLCQSLFDLPGVNAFLEKLKPFLGKAIKKEMLHRLHPPEKILFTRTTHISKIEKTYALFSLTDAPSEKAFLLGKMWRLYLWPSFSEACRLCHDKPEFSLLRYFKVRSRAPLLISQAFIHDLGVGVFIFVTLRHHWQLGRTLLNFAMARKTRSLKDKAQILGLNFNDVKNLAALE